MKMKTRYKILLVIAITSIVYAGLSHTILTCSSESECQIVHDIFEYVGFSFVTMMCSESDKINDPECKETTHIRLNNEGYFVLFFVLIPLSVILTIWYRDRK